jgi:NAD(P)H-flavin reductase
MPESGIGQLGLPQPDLGQLGLPIAAAIVATISLIWYLMPKKPKKFLDKAKPAQKKRVRVSDVKEITHDVKRIRLSFDSNDKILGLPVGKHIKVYGPNPEKCLKSKTWNGRDDPDKGAAVIQRSYTPVTGDEVKGYVDLVVKVYKPGTTKMADGKEVVWADGGKLGLYLDGVKVGDSVEISGPTGLIEYLGKGKFKYTGSKDGTTYSKVGMMAGGSGITPMLQVVAAALRDKADTTSFSLIYANKTEDDILVKDLLESAVVESNGRFKVYYTLDFPPEGWVHKKGFITQDMIKECLPPLADKPLMLMCGPPGMVQFACKNNLTALGYPKDTQLSF